MCSSRIIAFEKNAARLAASNTALSEGISSLGLVLRITCVPGSPLTWNHQSRLDATWKVSWSFIRSQGGELSPSGLPVYVDKPFDCMHVNSPDAGYVQGMRADLIGQASVLLGAGRLAKTDTIDYGAGIGFFVKIGDRVERGDSLCALYQGENSNLPEDIKTVSYEPVFEAAAPGVSPEELARLQQLGVKVAEDEERSKLVSQAKMAKIMNQAVQAPSSIGDLKALFLSVIRCLSARERP